MRNRHETKGVNHVDYYPHADKPYLLTTSDDRTVTITPDIVNACNRNANIYIRSKCGITLQNL